MGELSMHEEMMKRTGGDEAEDDDEDIDQEEIDKLEEEEWKGLKDEPLCPASERVTFEIFQEWKKKFDEEMIAAGVLKREEQKAKSGKQIFYEAQEGEKSPGKEGAAKE